MEISPNKSLPRSVLYSGTEQARPNAVSLRAGPLTMIFEPDTAFLRYVRLGDHEIVRGIYGAVRDRNWNTITPRLTNLQIDSKQESFRVSFDASCRRGEIDFFWTGTVNGDAEGKVLFEFRGEVRSTFWRNRIGLCVLHPIAECAGKPCRIEHPDGAAEEGVFPRHISPHQPFKNIRAISHDVAPGVRAEVRFAGDIFEMEDQRNWTDASFKTYSTPLEIPIPVEVRAGTRIEQSVTITVAGPARKVLPVVQGRPPQISISTTPILPKPAIGLCVASHGQPLTPREIDRLKKLNLSHLRVDLHLREAGYPAQLRQAAQEAKALGVGLHTALHLTDRAEAELDSLVQQLQEIQPNVSLWLVFHENETVTRDTWVWLARQRLAPYGKNILVAAGTDAYFVEINRARPSASAAALPCYSINPQVHAFDNTTMVENLAAQPMTVETLQQFCKQAAVISPITLKPRFNPDASGADATQASDELPAQVDVRQLSLFGAAWTLGSIARLATVSPLHSVTYFETTGWRGIMEREAGSPVPRLFPSQPGAVFPMYFVFASLAGFDRVCPTHSSHPLQIEAITLLDAANRRRVVVANLLSEAQEIKIKTGTCKARIRSVDERNALELATNPDSFAGLPAETQDSVAGKVELKLLPYALAIVDISD